MQPPRLDGGGQLGGQGAECPLVVGVEPAAPHGQGDVGAELLDDVGVVRPDRDVCSGRDLDLPRPVSRLGIDLVDGDPLHPKRGPEVVDQARQDPLLGQ